jgi:hypothetical protein
MREREPEGGRDHGGRYRGAETFRPRRGRGLAVTGCRCRRAPRRRPAPAAAGHSGRAPVAAGVSALVHIGWSCLW